MDICSSSFRSACCSWARLTAADADEKGPRIFHHYSVNGCFGFLAVPCRDGVHHAEQSQCNETAVEIAAELAITRAGFQDVLDQALVGSGEPPNKPAAISRQMLSLVPECLDIGTTIEKRGQMRLDDALYLVAGRARCGGNGNRRFENSFDPPREADLFKGHLGREIVIEARLPYPQYIGDILR